MIYSIQCKEHKLEIDKTTLDEVKLSKTINYIQVCEVFIYKNENRTIEYLNGVHVLNV